MAQMEFELVYDDVAIRHVCYFVTGTAPGNIFQVLLSGTNAFNRAINLTSRVFASGPEDRGSIPGRMIPKTLKMAPDAALLNTQHYKIRIKDKVEQSKE